MKKLTLIQLTNLEQRAQTYLSTYGHTPLSRYPTDGPPNPEEVLAMVEEIRKYRNKDLLS